MFSPNHIGAFIRDEIIEPRELTVTAAAESLGVGRQALSSLLNERQGLSPEMALRIEAAFSVKADTLLAMHHDWELAQARQNQAEITKNIRPVSVSA